MRRRVFEGVRYRVAAWGLAAGMLSAAVVGASVEVRGVIEGLPEGAPAQVSLVSVPPLYDLLAAVLADDPAGLYQVEATVDAVDGRFALEISEPGLSRVRVRSVGAASWTYLLVGPETDTLLPTLELQRRAFCTLTLEGPANAWIVRGGSLRDLSYSRYWTSGSLFRRLEAGRTTRYEFGTGRTVLYSPGSRREFVALTIGAPGYEPTVVECDSGAEFTVELKRLAPPIVGGVLRRDGSPVAGAILVRDDGWPAGTTDASGRYRTPEGVYRVYTADGGLDAVELVGRAGELAARAALPVAVSVRGLGSSRGGSPSWAAVHWSSAGAPLALERGRLAGGPHLVAARPGAARTTVLAEHFAPLTINWSAQPAALSLEPLLRLEGIAMDSTGAGVAGVEISIDEFGAVPMALSDGAGQFLVEVAEPLGRKRLVARATGYREASRDLTGALSAGQPERIVLELLPARAILGRLVSARSGGGVQGTVGLAREWGSQRFVGEAGLWNLQDPTMLQVVSTEDDGVFRLDPTDERNVRLVATAPGHGTVSRNLPAPDSDSRGHEQLGDFVLERETVLRGRVTDKVTGAGVEGARVRFGQTVRDGSAWAETDSGGEFRLRGFPVGAGVVTARADGYETSKRTLAEPPREPLELVLRPRSEVDVAGMVVRDGAPVTGASVSIGPVASVTGASGRFLLKSTPGQASLECRVPGTSQTIRRQLEVDAALGEVTIDVTPVVIRGRVIGPDGLPVSVAFVAAQRVGGVWFGRQGVRTGPEGDFELIVEPGSFMVSAQVDSVRGPEVDVAVEAGSEPYVELTVPLPGSLRVVVLGLETAEAAEVVMQVETRRDGGGTSSRTMTRATGGTATEPVFEMLFQEPAGTTTVIVAVASTGRSRRAPLRMAPTGVTEVEISFADGTGLVEGTVTLDGWPLAGERVHVTNERRNLAWSVTTDHRGVFLIDGLRVGDEIAVAAVGERRSARVTETVARVDLEARSAAVRGRLLDAETGLPASGMRVSAVPALSVGANDVTRAVRRQRTTRTADDGSFVIDGLFAAPYRLEIRPAGRNLSTELVVGSTDVDPSAGDLDVSLAVRAPVDQ